MLHVRNAALFKILNKLILML